MMSFKATMVERFNRVCALATGKGGGFFFCFFFFHFDYPTA